MNNKKLALTVGIPTCYSGESLYQTLKSLRASIEIDNFELIVVADRTPISKELKQKIEKLKVKLIWNRREGSQFKKVNQIIKMVKSDLFVFTQDDITFDSKTLSLIVKAFNEDKKLDMLGIRVLPLPPINFFESIIGVMIRSIDYVSGAWNKGENYISSSGRCLAFRTTHLKKFYIPENIINGDVYLYFENKKHNGKFKRSDDAIVYIRCPQSLKDQIGPSSRYQFSKQEVSQYFNFNLDKEYKVPKRLLLNAAFSEFIKNPIKTALYFAIFAITRLKKHSKRSVFNPLWKLELSTKKV